MIALALAALLSASSPASSPGSAPDAVTAAVEKPVPDLGQRRAIVKVSSEDIRVFGPARKAAEIKQMLRLQGNPVKACYARALQQDPRASGRVTATFAIEPDGRTSHVELQAEGLDTTPTPDCLADLLQRVRFRPRKGRVVVQFPFEFESVPLRKGPAAPAERGIEI